MEKIGINTHNFEEAKSQIAEFIEKVPPDIYLEKVGTEGLIPIFDHLVTGIEMNKLVEEIQTCLKRINETDITFFRMFGEVYNAFDSLDKDYIQAILLSLHAAEAAAEKAQNAQEDIRKTLNSQKTIISVLEQFKERQDQIEHLENIDEMWQDIKRLSKDVEYVKYYAEYLSGTMGQTVDFSGKTNSMVVKEQEIETIKHFDNRIGHNDILRKKVHIACLLSGSAVGICILHFLVSLLGII